MGDTTDRGPFRAYFKRSGDSLGPINFVASTEGIKRDGLDLRMDGGDINEYLQNPVVLWAHDYRGERLPIGRTVSLRKQKTRLKARVEFDPDDDFAMQVDRKYRAGYLNAVSIGWDETEYDSETRQVTGWTLLDISAVPVPGDPGALMERQAAMLRSYTVGDDDNQGGVPCQVCRLLVPWPEALSTDSFVGHLDCALRVGATDAAPPAGPEDGASGGATPKPILLDVADALQSAAAALTAAAEMVAPEDGGKKDEGETAEALSILEALS